MPMSPHFGSSLILPFVLFKSTAFLRRACMLNHVRNRQSKIEKEIDLGCSGDLSGISHHSSQLAADLGLPVTHFFVLSGASQEGA
jgi:hypothetical protein